MHPLDNLPTALHRIYLPLVFAFHRSRGHTHAWRFIPSFLWSVVGSPIMDHGDHGGHSGGTMPMPDPMPKCSVRGVSVSVSISSSPSRYHLDCLPRFPRRCAPPTSSGLSTHRAWEWARNLVYPRACTGVTPPRSAVRCGVGGTPPSIRRCPPTRIGSDSSSTSAQDHRPHPPLIPVVSFPVVSVVAAAVAAADAAR